MPVIPESGAICPVCKEHKPREQFYLRDAKHGNYFPQCKPCRNLYTVERLQQREGREIRHFDRTATEKPCSKCGVVLAVTDFPVVSKRTGERRRICQSCHNAETREYKQVNKERTKASRAAYYAANRETIAAKQREYRVAQPERDKATHHNWKQRNKDAVNAATHRRRSTIDASAGSFTAKEWKALKALYDHRCLMCGRQEPEIKLTIDHVRPVSKGGSNGIENLQPLCKSCNSLKYVGEVDLRGEV